MGDVFHVGLAYLCKTDSDIVIMSDDYSKFVWVAPEEFDKYIEDENLLNDLKKHGIINNSDDEELSLIF